MYKFLGKYKYSSKHYINKTNSPKTSSSAVVPPHGYLAITFAKSNFSKSLLDRPMNILACEVLQEALYNDLGYTAMKNIAVH